MLSRAARLLAPTSMAVTKSSLTPLDALTQIQLGITPPLSVQRGFLLEHCAPQLQQRGLTEAKLIAMDGKLCAQLLKRVVLELYLSVPFRVFGFDMEFTAPPVFTADGPTEDITEIGLYSPARDETFSCLVQPAGGRKQGPGVTELTHITDEMLLKKGLPFVEAWRLFLEFVNTPEPGEEGGAGEHILLLSHGGKVADVSLMKWTLEKFSLELPRSFVFGDTIHLIRDAHRRRPVTVDKHPPSWKLIDLVQWLKVPPTLPAHRAGNDAKMTWDALYHTLLRYGDDEMTPREQLVSRFFDEEAKGRMREHQQQVLPADRLQGGEGEDTYLAADAGPSLRENGSASGEVGIAPDSVTTTSLADNPLDLDLDDIFNDTAPSVAQPVPVFEEFSFDSAITGTERDSMRGTTRTFRAEEVVASPEDHVDALTPGTHASPPATAAAKQKRRKQTTKAAMKKSQSQKTEAKRRTQAETSLADVVVC